MEYYMLVLPEVTPAEDGMQNCVDFLELDILMAEAARTRDQNHLSPSIPPISFMPLESVYTWTVCWEGVIRWTPFQMCAKERHQWMLALA